MGLSPLYAAPANDLHVSTAPGLHPPFGGPRPVHAKITTFRVCAPRLRSHGCRAGPRCARALGRATRRGAQLLDPCFETGGWRGPARGGPPRPAPGAGFTSSQRPPGACFSPFPRGTRSAIGLGPVLWLRRAMPPRFALHSQAALLPLRARTTGAAPSPPTRSRVLVPRRAAHNRRSGPPGPLSLAAPGSRRRLPLLGLLICLSSARRPARRGARAVLQAAWPPPPPRRACPRAHSRTDASRPGSPHHEFRPVPRSSSTPEPSDPQAPLLRAASDPAAGSPTAALLRLLLPPGAGARGPGAARPGARVGRSDGRCVQRTGTQSARDAERAYGTFLVRGALAAPGPGHARGSRPRPLAAAPPCSAQCSTRAAQSVEGHHRPASAAALVRLVAGAPPGGGRLAR